MAVTVNGSVLTQTDVTSPSPSTLTYTSVVLTAGDVLVSVVAENSPSTFGTFSAPTGGTGLSWTQIILQQNTAGHFTEVVGYWTKIPSDQTSTITVSTTNTSDVGTGGALLRLSGVDQVSPIGLTDGFQGQTDPTGTDLQLAGTQAGSLIIMVGSDWSAGTASLTVSISNTTGGVTDLSNLESGQFRAVVAHGSQSSSINQGTLDYSAATGDWAAIIFEVKAAPAAGGLSFRPGKTWKRRYKHRQRLPISPIAAGGDFIADASATVIETDTVTAVVGKIGDVAATVTAGGTVSATAGAVGAVSATVTCGSTVTAVVGTVGAVSATVTCGSTVTASTVSGLIGTVTATITAGSTVSAAVAATGAVSTTVTSGSTVTTIVDCVGAVSATVTAGSTIAGVRAITNAAVTGTITVGSTVTPFLLGAVIDVNGRVVTIQTAASIVDVTSAPISQAGIDQSVVSIIGASSAAGGVIAVTPTSDGRAEVG